MKKCTIVLLLSIVCFPIIAKTIYVNGAFGTPGDGSSWLKPLNDISMAILKAEPADDIWVAKGIYVGELNLKEGVHIYGGFAGVEASISLRDYRSNETIISGNFSTRAISQPFAFEQPTTVDGFTIQDGICSLLGPHNGGGAFISKGTTIRNCKIVGNKVSLYGKGAGIYLNRGGVVEDCVITDNQSGGSGGGVAIGKAGEVSRCEIANNSSATGAGIYIDNENREPSQTISLSDITKSTAFIAGADGINTYRIPAIVCTKQGTLLVFCEARKASWKDHLKTAVVVKRSTDGGKTWSDMIPVASDNYVGAYADPCPVVDFETGEIHVLMNYWPAAGNRDPKNNTAWLATSTNDGQSWGTLRNVSTTMVAAGHVLQGVGVGSGIQMTGAPYKGRLIIPTRQMDKTTEIIKTRTVYSDDHGVTWTVGEAASSGGEVQFAESPNGRLIANQRAGTGRTTAISTNGGDTWSSFSVHNALFGVESGCQASIYAKDSVAFFTGPRGGSYSNTMDDRCRLTIVRSIDGGNKWSASQLLHPNGSGYSCITALPDGRLCVVFESGDNFGFIRTAAARPAGWMRLDVWVLPADIWSTDYWFTNN